MNKLIMAFILLQCGNLFAKEVSKDQEQNCLNAMAISEAAMAIRQNGLPLAEALNNLNKMVAKGESTEKEASLVKLILRDAYSKPKFSTESNKKESINEFSANYYLACMEGYESINK
ncbi:hypothetical protein [Acinetobacter sp. TAC-1]|uniref:hypothetical protein n=1 Tax=unclassified Acinetobacter TaxID=196816 RepID=UPI0023AA34A4|nr:hypothetical protein [Acinetobacter sp. TAC-1]WEE38576.1 hypothetical protein PYV58_16815 [Acinetobacter sp. TAC-1]